jgi:hypothetical protein
MRTTTLHLALMLVDASPGLARAKALAPAEVTEVVKTIDDRQRNSGDYRSLAYLEQKEKDKTDTAREAIVYRRSADQKLMILFTKPRARRGRAISGWTRTSGATTPPPASGTGAPSASASPAPTAAAPTSTSRGSPRSTSPRSAVRRSSVRSTPGSSTRR